MKAQREYWIDAVKILACVLVALGHFLQSMTQAAIISENTFLQIFDQSIYTFHVPLFFICSGYLYQKFSNVNTFASWRRSVIKKLIILGIPYVFFSTITWGLKAIFASQVNIPVSGLFDSLVLHPISPYWYLYCLFFVFVITPTAGSRTASNCLLVIALIAKVLSFHHSFNIYALSFVFANEFWFVLGMYICQNNINRLFSKKHSLYIGIGCITLFLACCILIIRAWSAYEQFLLGLIACIGIIQLAVYILQTSPKGIGCSLLAKYTMPIYLMHTLFAASWRTLLLKLGISSPSIHIVTGILISFIGPAIAAEIMERIKWADFILYPQKYIWQHKTISK